MGAVASRQDDGSAIYFKDQNKFTITNVAITSARRRSAVQVQPNAFPASRISACRDGGDESPVDFILDPNSTPGAPPCFLLRLDNEEELTFHFTITVRQSPAAEPSQPNIDTVINGLTFIFASSSKELDVLVTREFHADPNLHKNSNVELVAAEISTNGNPSMQMNFSWKWKPPKAPMDKGGGWRNACTFVEYDQRAHRLNTLASFSFWVNNVRSSSTPLQLPAQGDSLALPRMRLTSSHSQNTVASEAELSAEQGPPSPAPEPIEYEVQGLVSDVTAVDISLPRAGEDMSVVEDGPLFRATMKALESKTGSMRARMKKVLKKAEAAQAAQAVCNDAAKQFMDALREAATTNANAIQPALEHYFEKIAQEILAYENQNTRHLQKLIIDPLSRVYQIDIKAAEYKKKEFDEESKDYYAYVGRYLGQRQDSLKEKKRIESDSKYQSKRRNFELKRFDYSSFITDLHGGRKEQEVLSHLTKYADTQTKSYLSTAKKIEEMMPHLDALIREVNAADKEYRIQRTEREEKRRNLEKNKPFDSESSYAGSSMTAVSASNGASYVSDTELGRSESTAKGSLQYSTSVTSQTSGSSSLHPQSSVKSVTSTPVASPGNGDRFKGIRDLEDRHSTVTAASAYGAGQQRKEGLLWALSRPGSHVDPRGLNKQAWHKFWIVLDQGKLSEYTNWKERLDPHMDPIDLRLASVREARNSERRFCFEVITPNYKRVYQATSEEDMNDWITAVNNALQSAFENRGQSQAQAFAATSGTEFSRSRDIGSVLTGKASHSSSLSSGVGNMNSSGSSGGGMLRRTTVAGRPSIMRTDSNIGGEDPAKLLQEIRERDQGNKWCADCDSTSKVEWVSINLGILLCIECSGTHRALGTHISKVRSLTLDTKSFTVDIVEVIMQIGNRLSNQVWEATMDRSLKPAPNAGREERLRFATNKYAERLYVKPIIAGQSHYATADETLLASVKQNDIQQVLYALACRANPNAKDRSRSTPAIFLALAAVDPAAPPSSVTASASSHTPTASYSSTTTGGIPPSGSSGTGPGATAAGAGAGPAGAIGSALPRTAKPNLAPSFPVAELLLQNGGDLPTQLPAFPLSLAAKTFFEQRGRKPEGTDTLTALPSLRGPGGMGSGMGMGSSGERERERLQKRNSAGNRYSGRIGGFVSGGGGG